MTSRPQKIRRTMTMPNYEKNQKTKLWSIRFRVIENNIAVRKRLSGYKTQKLAYNAYLEYMRKNPDYDKLKSLGYNIDIDQLYLQYRNYKESRLKPSSMYELDGIYYRLIKNNFNHASIISITKLDIMKWQQNLIDLNYSYKYKKKIRCILNGMFKFAVMYLDLPTNPVEHIEPFRNLSSKPIMNVWSIYDYKLFISKVDNPIYSVYFELLYVTGCRKSELLALCPTDIIRNTHEVRIHKTVTRKVTDKPYEVLNTPKTKASIRKVMLPLTTYNRLLIHISDNNISNDEFIFYKKNPLPETSIQRKLDHYCKISGVTRLKVHEFRHSHVSLLIASGESIVTISARLGHANIEETLNTYSHLMPGQDKELTDNLNELLI